MCISIARLVSADAARMHQVERWCFPLPWSEEQCAAALGQESFAAFGVFRGAALAGYISLYHVAREIEILNLAVLPQERRRGHGRRLTRVVLRLARKLGMEKAFLEVRSDNVPAVSLYLACGFRCEGIRRKYYTDGTDAHLYVCSLR